MSRYYMSYVLLVPDTFYGLQLTKQDKRLMKAQLAHH